MLHITGKVVVLDYGFYVIQGFGGKTKKGVYGSAIIKKRRYWPQYIYGETSGLTSLKKVLGPWMHFVVSLIMFIFMTLIRNRKTIS